MTTDPAGRRSHSSWTSLADGIEARFVEALPADVASGARERRDKRGQMPPAFAGSPRLVGSR